MNNLNKTEPVHTTKQDQNPLDQLAEHNAELTRDPQLLNAAAFWKGIGIVHNVDDIASRAMASLNERLLAAPSTDIYLVGFRQHEGMQYNTFTGLGKLLAKSTGEK